jgi:hypothetical protein
MPIFDLYSKRKKAIERSEKPDVYQYEVIPENVINQISMIFCDAISNVEELWKYIITALAREYGDPSVLLSKQYDPSILDSRHSCLTFLKTEEIDKQLDLIELSCNIIHNNTYQPERAINELNYRLREGGVGYQFENGVIVRMDSQFVHARNYKKSALTTELHAIFRRGR